MRSPCPLDGIFAKGHHPKGFTLVEVLISAVILSLLVVGITSVLNLGNLTFPLDLAQMELQQQARQAMQWLTRELRESSNIQISVLNSDTDRISFDTYAGQGIAYYPDSADFNSDGLTNQIIREYPAGTRRIIAGNISRFKFTPGAPLLRIDITAQQPSGQKQLSFSLTEQVRLRNE